MGNERWLCHAERSDFFSVRWIVEIHREDVKALGCPTRMHTG